MGKLPSAWKMIVAVSLILVAGMGSASAFGVEPVFFINPADDLPTDDPVSSIHNDLTYVLALAAGLSEADSQTLQIYDQLTESEQLGPGSTVAYTNCTGSFPPTPDPAMVCAPGTNGADVQWPLKSKMKDPAACVTSAYGPYGPFFHFPRNVPSSLGALHDWAWGTAPGLIGTSAYAWDSAGSLLDAKCTYIQGPESIQTGMSAGSLQAFGTYLHSLADFYSHQTCQSQLSGIGFPWGTHTIPTPPATQKIYVCDYDPAHPTSVDAHGREFGATSDSAHTDAAILAVYAELSEWSTKKGGSYAPLPLSAVLAGIPGSPTLQQALYTFVHTWTYAQAQERRNYADLMRLEILAIRSTPPPTPEPTPPNVTSTPIPVAIPLLIH